MTSHQVPKYQIERVQLSDYQLDLAAENQFSYQMNLSQEARDQGVKVLTLEEARKYVPNLLKKADRIYSEKFQYDLDIYHQSSQHHEILYIPKNIQLSEPIVINGHYNASDISHLWVIADENAQVLIQNHSTSLSNAEMSIHQIQLIYALPGAKVYMQALDRLAEKTTAFIRRFGYTGRAAQIDWVIGQMNHGDVILDSHVDLYGAGSESDLRIIGVSSKSQKQAVNSLVTNIGHHSRGFISQRGIILDQSTMTFNGIGKIIKNAKHADNDQESRVIMLSDRGRGDTNPILLIDEFEVVAGHAASIGKIHEEDLFYLMSRGLSRELAENLFIKGFLLDPITDHLGHDVSNHWLDVFRRKLDKND